MIELIKEKEENLQSEKYDYCYKLVNGEQLLGFGTINKNEENKIFIYINENQRGNGYGKILFSKMLGETKNLGYDDIEITFSKENKPMEKIANDNGGKRTSVDKDSVKYIFN